MKNTLLLIALFSASSYASDYRVQKVKVLGPMKHKVIFQSRELKKIKRSNVLKGKLVAQWGTQVFEVVQGLYACDGRNLCRLSEYQRIATFQQCFVRNEKKVECRKRLDGGRSSGQDSSGSEIVIHDRPDSTADEFARDRTHEAESDFPVRTDGEFDDIF